MNKEQAISFIQDTIDATMQAMIKNGITDPEFVSAVLSKLSDDLELPSEMVLNLIEMDY